MSDADRTPVIIDAVRTPVGRAGGALSSIRADDLLAHAIRALVERDRGAARPRRGRDRRMHEPGGRGQPQRGPDGRAACRPSGRGRRPDREPVVRVRGAGRRHGRARDPGRRGRRVHRRRGREHVARALGHAQDRPGLLARPARASRTPPSGGRFANPAMPERWTIPLAETAEVVAEEHGVGREDQDAFAVESQRRASEAIEGRAVRRRDRADRGPAEEGRPRAGDARRAPPPRHDRGATRPAAGGLSPPTAP